MTTRIEQVESALTKLAHDIDTTGAGHGNSSLLQHFGWNCPPLNTKQLSLVARTLAAKIASVPEDRLNSKFTPDAVIAAIDSFTGTTLPYFWNGNAAQAVPAYFALINWIDSVFEPVYSRERDWEKMAADGLLPKQITKKLQNYKASIGHFDKEFATLGEKIAYIQQAHDAAESLPTDLENLRSARDEVIESKTAAERSSILAEKSYEEIQQLLLSIQESEQEARRLVENTEDAYSAATTRGLGESFQRRAESLSNSMWTWVAGLTIALGLGALTGHYRVQSLQQLLATNASSGAITLNMVLAILSVAAPIWFAWLATKQIGHRFRLSEDYAFKASVAQAYEGYRREAARVDPDFAKRLFGSALDRLDEAPIRFVEHETFGSPWHEFARRRGSKSSASETPQKPVLVSSQAQDGE